MRISVPFFSLFLILGCGEAPDSNAQGEQTPPSDKSGIAASASSVQVDNPFEQDGEEQQPAESTCPDEAGLSCVGSLQIRAVNVSLSRDTTDYVVRGSLQFKNLQTEPMQFAFVHVSPNLRLSNGAAFEASPNYVFRGRIFCSDQRSAEECYARSPENFALLEQGDSPLEVNFQYQNRNVETSLIQSMPDVKFGTMNFSIITVEASGSQRRRDISINSIPIAARIGP